VKEIILDDRFANSNGKLERGSTQTLQVGPVSQSEYKRPSDLNFWVNEWKIETLSINNDDDAAKMGRKRAFQARVQRNLRPKSYDAFWIR
jgi:hypothetical protein